MVEWQKPENEVELFQKFRILHTGVCGGTPKETFRCCTGGLCWQVSRAPDQRTEQRRGRVRGHRVPCSSKMVCGGSTPKKARCDLWDYLSHRPEYQHLYRGTYMANYSWGELTIDELEH